MMPRKDSTGSMTRWWRVQQNQLLVLLGLAAHQLSDASSQHGSSRKALSSGLLGCSSRSGRVECRTKECADIYNTHRLPEEHFRPTRAALARDP